MPEALPHEPSAHERHVHQQIRNLTEATLLAEPNIARVAWQEIDKLLDHLNDLGRVAVWPQYDDMGSYMEREQ